MANTERDELGDAGGKGTWFIIFIVVLMAAISIGYAVTYFVPDVGNWFQEGSDPDKIIWKTELGK